LWGTAARPEAAAAEEVPRYETFLDYGIFGPTRTVTLDLERRANPSICTVVAASHIKITRTAGSGRWITCSVVFQCATTGANYNQNNLPALAGITLGGSSLPTRMDVAAEFIHSRDLST
jgi:hypothetical protein